KLTLINDKKGNPVKRKVKTWIGNLIERYKSVDGKPLGEKNPKWLQDDYVKFILFAQWKIEQAGEGLLGFITNHSYLDNPTFRGMRQALMDTFDEIYLLDLHGNSLKKEKCPDGSKDENVFDIRQGVTIAIFVKKKGEKSGCKVYHSDLWGLREKKGDWLHVNSIKTTKWKKLTPKTEYYLFIPREEKHLREYEKYPKIPVIFPVNSVGIVTARDNLTIKWTPEEVWQTVLNFSKLDSEIARKAYNLGKDARDWKVTMAQKDLLESDLDKSKIVPILYRPFDIRYTYYTGKSRGFHCMPRPEVMWHMIKKNMGLITIRRSRSQESWKYALVTDNIIAGATAITSLDINYLFPLYLYKQGEPKKRKSVPTVMMLFEPRADYEVRQPNLSPALIVQLTKSYKKEPSPEDIFYYIYAILYSNIYRDKYAEFLKSDFPRIPFTNDYKLFARLAGYGKTLVDLHLLKTSEIDKTFAKFQGRGENKVEKIKRDDEQNRIYINSERYFDGIEKEIWEYQIGGYQVLDKWLKERKGKTLSLTDVKHYCNIASSLKKTLKIQKGIDSIYQDVEKTSIKFEI
ncbi:MAG: type ISP restriction/modification enzyme, partial [bacterium]